MSDISKLSRKQICDWIKKFEKAIAVETDENNIRLYKKWKKENCALIVKNTWSCRQNKLKKG